MGRRKKHRFSEVVEESPPIVESLNNDNRDTLIKDLPKEKQEEKKLSFFEWRNGCLPFQYRKFYFGGR